MLTTGTTWCIGLARMTEWLITPEMPSTVSIGVPGWRLVTPKAFPGALKTFAGDSARSFPDGSVWVSADLMILHTDKAVARGDDRTEPPYEIARNTLRAIRTISRQFDISDVVTSLWVADPSDVASAPKVEPAKIERTHVRDYLVPTLIRSEHMSTLATLGGKRLPPHVPVMLDALKAFTADDYTQALLYAAIATEALAGATLDEWAADALAKRESRHRVIELPIADGQVQAKDPIYEVLTKGDDFGRLLHERPLYLRGRSVLVENQDLFRRAKKLYATRNKIAHTADVPPEPDKVFPLSRDGARDGLATAVELAGWFGDAGPYFVWAGFVDAVTGEVGRTAAPE